MIRRFRAVVPAQGSRGPQPVWRVGTVLKSVLGLSRPERVRAWRDGAVTVNGAAVAVHYIHCRPGDVIEAWYPEPASSVEPEPALPLRVLYEDAWLLAVDKPAGQLSHPARGEQSGTVANAVAGYLASRTADGRPRTAETPQREPIRLIHRLDRDTSGVLLFARDAATARALARARAAGALQRTYLALVAGRPLARGEIRLAIGPDAAHRTRQVAYAPAALAAAGGAIRAAAAHTTYQVIQYGRVSTLVAARLGTGRTHQVRVHFTAIGHPLVGDDLYGGPANPSIARQALHAWSVRLLHPASGRWLTITAPLPLDFRATARALLAQE